MENFDAVEIKWEDLISALKKTEILKILMSKSKTDFMNWLSRRKIDLDLYLRRLAKKSIEVVKKGFGIAKRFLKKVFKKAKDKFPYVISIKITKKV